MVTYCESADQFTGVPVGFRTRHYGNMEHSKTMCFLQLIDLCFWSTKIEKSCLLMAINASNPRKE